MSEGNPKLRAMSPLQARERLKETFVKDPNYDSSTGNGWPITRTGNGLMALSTGGVKA